MLLPWLVLVRLSSQCRSPSLSQALNLPISLSASLFQSSTFSNSQLCSLLLYVPFFSSLFQELSVRLYTIRATCVLIGLQRARAVDTARASSVSSNCVHRKRWQEHQLPCVISNTRTDAQQLCQASKPRCDMSFHLLLLPCFSLNLFSRFSAFFTSIHDVPILLHR